MSGGPGAKITATTLPVPSNDRFPPAGVAVPTLIIFPAAGGLASNAQLLDTAYQSGSDEASTSLSSPSVRQGRRPTVLATGNVGEHVPTAMPSDAVPALPGASGHGSRPGKSFPRSSTSFTTYPMSATFACCKTWALTLRVVVVPLAHLPSRP